MADINEYLDGLDIKFSEQEKQLADIFAESWEYCRSHTCGDCEYAPNGKYIKMLLCMSCQYAKRLIAADVAPVKHGRWIPISDGAWAECSECGEACDVSDNGGMTAFELFCDCYKYCPTCGAKMDGGKSDE